MHFMYYARLFIIKVYMCYKLTYQCKIAEIACKFYRIKSYFFSFKVSQNILHFYAFRNLDFHVNRALKHTIWFIIF